MIDMFTYKFKKERESSVITKNKANKKRLEQERKEKNESIVRRLRLRK